MLRVTMLGSFEVFVDGKPVLTSTPKLAPFMAWLILCAEKRQSHATPFRQLWPESDSPKDAFDKGIRRLKEALGEEAHRLVVEGGMVQFESAGAEIDTVEFMRCIDEGTEASLERAVNLYGGPLLLDWEEKMSAEWFEEARQDLASAYEYALDKLARRYSERSEWRGAARILRIYTSKRPAHDRAWEMLIQVELAAGNLNAALENYRDYANFCRRRGVQPSAKLEDQIRGAAAKSRDRTLVEINASDAIAKPKSAAPARFDQTEGAVKLASPYYVRRRQDHTAVAAMQEEDGYTIRIKGARQTGKSSLLARLLQQERQDGSRVLLTDWSSMTESEIATGATFFASLAANLAAQCETAGAAGAIDLAPGLPPHLAFERFLIDRILAPADGPVIWGIDQADHIFPCAFRDEVFGVFRGWHNRRATVGGHWTKLSLIITYSTDAQLFIRDLNQSPFNVGTPIELSDLTSAEATEFNGYHGNPLGSANLVQSVYSLLGGHPYLWRRCLHALRSQELTLEALNDPGRRDRLYSDHLANLFLRIDVDADLKRVVRQVLAGEPATDGMAAHRLLASGVLTGHFPNGLAFRCELYREYLERHLK